MSKLTPKAPAAAKGKAVKFSAPVKTPGAIKSVEKMMKGTNRSKGKINLK